MADKVEMFNTRMLEQISSGSSAKDLIEKMVRSALEVEYGPTFSMNEGFSKMVSKIADAVITNPELRRQALSVASTYINKKREETRLRKPEPAQPVRVQIERK